MGAILFFDPVCQQPYDTRTLRREAMGGTEASLTRVADALDAYVMQHNRADSWGRYLPVQPLPGVARSAQPRPRALPRIRELFPGARVCLWLHDPVESGLHARGAGEHGQRAAWARGDRGVRLGFAAARRRSRAARFGLGGRCADHLQPGR
jgi:hypothetical protein